jgi:integrase
MPRLSLTDRFAAGAKSAQVQTDYFDDKVVGLALRVSSSGRKTWTFLFTSPKDGKRARMTLGGYPQTSLAQARTLALEARGQLDEGHDPRDARRAQAVGAMTLAALIASYLEKHARPNLRSAKEFERRLTKNVIPLIGDVKLGELHRRDVNSVIDPVLKRERRVEASHVFEDLRAVLRWAVARGDLDRNPIEGMKRPNGSAPRQRVLSDDEICTLWNGLPTTFERSKASQRIVKLCLLTAQRVGEVAGMAVSELDLPNAIWTIPAARSKNKRSHIVPLTAPAIELIRDAVADAGKGAAFVFPNETGAGGLSNMFVAKTLARARDGVGLAHWTAHDLRRTALTNFAKLGIPPVVAGAVANNSSVTKATITLAVYTQYSYEKEKREALELWAQRLAEIVKSGRANA